jgi:hypothetical protein
MSLVAYRTSYRETLHATNVAHLVARCSTLQTGSLTGNFCGCAECKIDGVRFPPPRFHDCDYCRKRSALVPRAEKIANDRVPIRPAYEDDGKSSAEWTRAFATAMDALSAPLLNGAYSIKPV